MLRDLPSIIHEVGFDFNWSNEKVWKLDLPVEKVDINELIWHFDYPFIWPIPEGYKSATPNDVLKNPNKFKDEYQRMMKADISYPIDMMFWKNRWLIMDGLHRLMQQFVAKESVVRVRKVPSSAIPLILRNE
jgi:hypothetical protein